MQFDCKEYEHVPVQNHDQDISHINIVFVTRHRRTNCDSVAESVPDRPPDHPRTIFVSYRMIHSMNFIPRIGLNAQKKKSLVYGP